MVALATHSPHQNHLLDALPSSDYERLGPHLELLPMRLGDVLYESGIQLRYVYFPTTAILSLLYVMEDGASAEIAIVGNEGILGISLFMGGETTPSRAVVQSAGHAFRLKADLLKNEFGRSGPTMHLLLRYTQALITQMAQTAACNRHHSVDQQLCRWLLLSLDRLSYILFMQGPFDALALGDVADRTHDERALIEREWTETDVDGKFTAVLTQAVEHQTHAHRSSRRPAGISGAMTDVSVAEALRQQQLHRHAA